MFVHIIGRSSLISKLTRPLTETANRNIGGSPIVKKPKHDNGALA